MQAVYENGHQGFYCRDSRYVGGTLGYRSHLHYQIELAFVFDGHTRVSVDSVEYEAHGGDVIIVFPNQIHTFITLERENYILLKVDPEKIPELIAPLTSSVPQSNVIKGLAGDEELSSLIGKLSETYYGDEEFKDEIIRGYLLAFFGKLLQRIDLYDSQSGDYHVVGMIMNYCNNNYDKPLSLSVLSKELHLNKYYISHIMSNKLNIGFNDYINSIRISNACRLLVKGDRTITQVSEAVGFNTLRTFNRAFSKQMNCTPSEYRQRKKREGKTPAKIKSSETEKE